MRRLILIGLLCLGMAACTPDNNALPTLAVISTLTTEEMPLLDFWSVQAGTLAGSDDSNTWLVTALAGDAIRVGAVENGAPVVLSLVDISGAVIASGDTLQVRIPADGLYRVVVRAGGSTQYTLGLTYTDRPDPNAPTPISVIVGVPTPTPPTSERGPRLGELLPNLPIGGVLTAREPSHLYDVTLRAGQFFTVAMTRVSGTTDPYLRLYNPDGTLIGEDDNSAGQRSARLLNVRAETAGVYQVEATGRDTYGEYQLTLQPDFVTPTADLLPTPVPLVLTPYATPTLGALLTGTTRLTDHVAALGLIQSPSGFQEFSFSVAAGDTVSIGVSPFGSSGLRPTFDVYDPEGALLASVRGSSSQDGGNAYVASLRLNLAGSYLLIVSGENASQGGFTVSYGVGTSRINNFKGSALAESRLTSTLTPKGVRDTWSVTLQAGDIITVAATSADGALNPSLDMSDLEGVPLASDDNGSGSNSAVLRSVEIRRTGQYLIRVWSARGDQIGSYTLLWRYINQASAAAAAEAQTTLLSIDDRVQPDEYRFYRFYGLEGQTLRVQVRPRNDSPLDAVAVLFAPDETVLAQGDDDDGLNPQFDVTLPRNGTYTLRVNGYLTAGALSAEVKWLFR